MRCVWAEIRHQRSRWRGDWMEHGTPFRKGWFQNQASPQTGHSLWGCSFVRHKVLVHRLQRRLQSSPRTKNVDQRGVPFTWLSRSSPWPTEWHPDSIVKTTLTRKGVGWRKKSMHHHAIAYVIIRIVEVTSHVLQQTHAMQYKRVYHASTTWSHQHWCLCHCTIHKGWQQMSVLLLLSFHNYMLCNVWFFVFGMYLQWRPKSWLNLWFNFFGSSEKSALAKQVVYALLQSREMIAAVQFITEMTLKQIRWTGS